MMFKKVINLPENDAMIDAIEQSQKGEDSSCYIIGSSRVQSSFDPSILKHCFNNVNVYNWGISGCTFLYNCIIADALLEQKGDKILFIELSSISSDVPPLFLELEKMAEINTMNTIKNLSQDQPVSEKFLVYINFLDSKIFNSLSIRKEVDLVYKKLLKKEISSNTSFGYVETSENEIDNIDSFLNYTELAKPLAESEYKEGTLHRQYIEYLLEKAKKHKANIYFFLPVTYNSNVEKHLVIPIFNALPQTVRVDYDSTFLNAVSRAEYLIDKNHLNKKGAGVYSAEFCRLLKSTPNNR